MSVKKNNKKPTPVNNPIATKGPKQPIPVATPPTNVSTNNADILALKEEVLKWLFSIIGAILVYLVVANVISNNYHPDINALLALANKLSFAGDARPEPMESLLFRSGVVTIGVGILGFYMLFSKMKLVKKLADTPFFLLFTALCVIFVIVLIYFDFAAPNPFAQGGWDQPQNSRDFVAKTNFEFFFKDIFLGNNLFAYTFFLVPAIACLFYFGINKYKWEDNRFFQKGVSIFGYVVVAGIILAIVLMNTFYFPYAFENKYDFNAVYNSMTQVYAGVPMLVDGFSNTYGLYPHFLNLIFHFIGLDVFKFSFLLSLLTGLAFLFNFLFLKKYVSNKVILLLAFCSVVFLPYLDFKFLTPYDCSFATFPIRYIIPSTLILLAAVYAEKRSQAIYWVTFILMGFFVLWNPEIGIVSYAAWLAFNIYNDFFTGDGKANIKKILLHIISGVGVIVLVFLVFKGVFYIFYGAYPDLGSLFGLITAFANVGFGLLPMKLVHPWNLEAIVIILGFTYSIVKWLKKSIDPKTSVIFLVSVISLGFLVYFQGRSHNWSFAASCGFCMVLLAILGDELWIKIKNSNLVTLHLLFVVFLFGISFSFFEIIFNTDKINELIYQEDDKEKQQPEEDRIKSNTEFINKNSKEKEKIFLFTAKQYQGLYFDGNKRQSAFNPGFQDMFLNTDLVKLEERIRDSSYNIFLEPAFCNFYFMPRPLAAVAATYETQGASQTMAMLVKRKTKVTPKIFLGRPDNVIHRKYNDDTAGIKLRINDALGVGPILLNTGFSVEALFYAKDQIYQYATLIGNTNDSSGFVIAKILNSPNYFFGINAKGISLPVDNNEWVYCVMDVFPDHFEIYVNGNKIGVSPLAAPFRQSPEKLFIGNGGFLRYYIGAISEIAVNDKALDNQQIEATWENIKGSMLQ